MARQVTVARILQSEPHSAQSRDRRRLDLASRVQVADAAPIFRDTLHHMGLITAMPSAANIPAVNLVFFDIKGSRNKSTRLQDLLTVSAGCMLSQRYVARSETSLGQESCKGTEAK